MLPEDDEEMPPNPINKTFDEKCLDDRLYCFRLDIIDIKHISYLIIDQLVYGVVPSLPSLEHSGILSLMKSGVADYGADNDDSSNVIKTIITKIGTLKYDS